MWFNLIQSNKSYTKRTGHVFQNIKERTSKDKSPKSAFFILVDQDALNLDALKKK